MIGAGKQRQMDRPLVGLSGRERGGRSDMRWAGPEGRGEVANLFSLNFLPRYFTTIHLR